jgi:hypothetical protein
MREDCCTDFILFQNVRDEFCSYIADTILVEIKRLECLWKNDDSWVWKKNYST